MHPLRARSAALLGFQELDHRPRWRRLRDIAGVGAINRVQRQTVCLLDGRHATAELLSAIASSVAHGTISFAHNALPPQLANLQWFDLTTGPFDMRVEDLIRNLKTREME